MFRRTITIALLALHAAAQNPLPPAPPSPPAGVDPTQVPKGSVYPLPTAAPKETPFSQPFRTVQPKTSFELSKDWQQLLGDGHEMYRLWRESPSRGFDEHGRPTSAEKHYATLRERVSKQLDRQGGMLRAYRTDEVAAARRQTWAFLSLFVTPEQDAVDLLRYLPYEPDAGVRQAVIECSLPFLAAQARATEDGDASIAKHFVDAAPWIDLTRAPEARDRILGLTALTEIAKARRVAMRATLPYMKRWFPDLLRSKSELLRQKARDFVATLEPQASFPKDIEASVDYFERVYKQLFPPIRLNQGRCELHPSPELDALVEVGRAFLADASMTKRESAVVRTKLATFEKLGFRILRLPEGLDKVGFAVGDIITTLDGLGTTNAKDMLAELERGFAAGKRRFVVEWVDTKGVERVRTFEVMPQGADGG
ncbi:MAG TPA: hypothetical protein PKE00_00560 [Planctomycetota bacterium]|nr:hypothetical protein [Planctomycetota bacterium]